jgi:predicted metalloprotease with PDZ domain
MKVLFLLLLINITVTAKEFPNKYILSVTDAKHHLAEVEVEFNGVVTRTLEVKLPVWRTGNYEILDLSKNIRQFQAFDAAGKPLTWHKTNKNTWKIFVNTPNIVKVKYQTYANLLRKRVSHIDETHAYLDASGVFVYSESQRKKPLTVQLNVPTGWRSASGMEKITEHGFKAENYDVLVDSPIESGIHYYDSFKVEEQTYEIVIWGEGNFDAQQIKVDIAKLHYQAKALWKSFPFKRYVYMFHAGDKLRGATEHLNSTIIQADRFGFSPAKKYRKVIGTTAHEFIHTWNVKAYRPAGISPYDYTKENYSDLFWMAEGTTSFYDNLFNVRAEIYTLKQYLAFLAEDINEFRQKPGRHIMSLSETSFDTWLENNPNRRHNTTVSIYLKGSLVSWLMDKEIRQLTHNRKSLDDLHYLLYKNYKSNPNGYSSYNVKQLLKRITKHDFSQFWQDYIDGTKAINFDELLAFYGLQIEKTKEKELPTLSLGIETDEKEGLLILSIVDYDGAAWKAGLTVGDSLVALNGYQINEANYKKQLENLEIGKTYQLDYFNQGILRQTTIVPQMAAPDKIKIIPLEVLSKQQKSHFLTWTKHNIQDLNNKDK